MHCLVTAGPTFESLDQVRRLTNFSTGTLGTELACFLQRHGHRVTLLRGYYATCPAPAELTETLAFTTTDHLKDRLHEAASAGVGAVFHAAAVSDFGFGKVLRKTETGELVEVKAGKFSTRDGPLLAELVPTPKLLPKLRSWFGKAWLAGWKYEVDGGRDSALAAGKEQLRTCDTDCCVVNGPAYGEGFGCLFRDGGLVHAQARQELFAILGSSLTSKQGG